MNEQPSFDAYRSSPEPLQDGARLEREIDAYLTKNTRVREEFGKMTKWSIKPSFTVELDEHTEEWSIAPVPGGMKAESKTATYTFGKQGESYVLSAQKKGEKAHIVESSSPEYIPILKAFYSCLDRYAKQIERGDQAHEAREQLKQTIKRRRSPEQ